MAYTYVADVDLIPKGGMKSFNVEGGRVLLLHLDSGFYATQAKCPHLGMPLEKGRIKDGCHIVCKYHHAEFDVTNGGVCQWAHFPPGIQLLNVVRGKQDLKTYPTRIEDGKVFVDLVPA